MEVGEIILHVMYEGQSKLLIPDGTELPSEPKLYVNGNLYDVGAFFEIVGNYAVWKNRSHTIGPRDIIKIVS